MTFHKMWIAAGLALAFGSMPAWGADWGGVKDIGGGVAVPVPAPVPVPTYDADSDWYVGLALGANVAQHATVDDFDVDNLGNVSSGVFAKDGGIGDSPIFGLNFGRYITPSLRAEVAIDYTPSSRISRSGTFGYDATNSAPSLTFPDSIDTNHYSVYRSDISKLSRTTGLVNLLYDIDTGTRFKPYIGGGIGFTWRQIRRNYSETSTCNFSENSNDTPPSGGSCVNTPALPNSLSSPKGSETKDQIDFAAAVQAGIGYEINQWITWDNGWQMLWESNAIASSAPSVSGSNRIIYKDSTLHQFRSGLRIKFD